MAGDSAPQEQLAKVCRFCHEQIHARARRCPHCRMPQTKWAFTLHPAAVAVVMLACAAMPLTMAIMFRNAFGSGTAFAGYRALLVPVQTEMAWGESDKGPVIAVVGSVQNNSRIPWKEIQIEVRFMDQQGRLMDVGTGSVSAAVEPGSERSFKVEVYPYLPKERYASYKVFIRGATDGRSRW